MSLTHDALGGNFMTFLGDSAIIWKTTLICLPIFWPLLCSFFRYQRRDKMHRKFSYPDRASLSLMTNDHAHAIVEYLAALEFPKIFTTSLQFALFKTYGFASMSKLLVATKEFSTPENASKRYADTGVLIGEFVVHPPTSERTIKAIARMNYIHGQYQKAGRISQDDMLYTLSVFITEPVNWINEREWRTLTQMEICAMSTLWKSIGDAMGIEYKKLARSAQGWKDGIEFYEDISAWALAYEIEYLKPAESNKKTADQTTALLLYNIPKRFKAAGLKVVSAIMPDNLRTAMMYEKPSSSYFTVVNLIFSIRKYTLRYLSLPRPSFMAIRDFDPTPDPQTGRYYYRQYQAHPFYNKPGFWNRWGPEALFMRLIGSDVPGDKGDLFIPQGYKFEEVGPKWMHCKGMDETEAWEKKLATERTGGCPFAFQ